jgi:hypothetical protein
MGVLLIGLRRRVLCFTVWSDIVRRDFTSYRDEKRGVATPPCTFGQVDRLKETEYDFCGTSTSVLLSSDLNNPSLARTGFFLLFNTI